MSKLITILFPFLLFTQNRNSEQKVDAINQRALHICAQADKELFCRSYHFFKNKQYDSCYVNAGKALLTTQNTKEKDLLLYFLSESAHIKKLHKKSLQSIQNISDDPLFSNIKNILLGHSYLYLKKYDTAIYHYEKWLKDSNNEADTEKRIVLHNLGIMYNVLTQNKKAEYYLKQEFELIKDQNDTLVKLNSLQAMANLYYELYRDTEAIANFKEAYKLAKAYSSFKWKHVTSENMAIVEKNRKNYKASVSYFEEARNWKDSIYNQDRIWELTEKEKQIAVAQKELEIAVEKEKVKRQKTLRNALIIGISFLFIFIMVLWFFYKQRTAQNKLITEQKEALTRANKTKDYLFSVVSHDLRSPINTLNKLHKKFLKQINSENFAQLKTTANKALMLTESTSKLLNNVLHWSLEQNKQMVFTISEYPLHKLVELVVYDFLNIAEAKQIKITESLQPENVSADVESLKIIIRNLIDNAIKYSNEGTQIDISCGTTNDNLKYISIQDQGKGMSPEVLAQIRELNDISIDQIDRANGVGLGMILCQTLIKKNNGKLLIESSIDKGSKFTILLP
ncbi:tetratricopeptide repeat-containing sensor histidine kinase [Flavicella marina]|uniref:tetratricopeptide repeat-containing sensor histidine kinase n=1 Tax=Flavicella marina TaxID=1475951 RepID=UPI001263EF4B|nr:tetratricopeptide repeat-containing sensor histidine kinase [Flavicella marina]